MKFRINDMQTAVGSEATDNNDVQTAVNNILAATA